MIHLFDEWEKIEGELKGRRLFIFLDFDGTLAPIARTPGQVVLPAGIRRSLTALAKRPGTRIAFVSGRALEDLTKKIGLKKAIYVGNHGLEIEGSGVRFRPPSLPPRYRRDLELTKADLKRKLSFIRGIFWEDKRLSLSLHYRRVDTSEVDRLKAIFYHTVSDDRTRGKFKVKTGKMVLEIRPPVAWDKGRAVLRLLHKQGRRAAKNEALPVYIGDDDTDEDAFHVLRRKGLTIRVGRKRDSRARYYLNDPAQVAVFLSRISGRAL